MKGKFYIPIFVFLLVLTPFMYATTLDSFGTFEKNTTVRITQVCADASYINISSVSYPNSSVAVSNIEMISVGSGEFYYDFDSTNDLDKYDVRGISDGCLKTFATSFYITENGKENPTENVIIFFSIIFMIFIGGFVTLLLYTIFKMFEWDFYAKELIINISSYFLLFTSYILGKEYFGNSTYETMLLWLIIVGSVTNVILPIIAFVLTYVRSSMEQ
jgi:hypothetical protein